MSGPLEIIREQLLAREKVARAALTKAAEPFLAEQQAQQIGAAIVNVEAVGRSLTVRAITTLSFKDQSTISLTVTC